MKYYLLLLLMLIFLTSGVVYSSDISNAEYLTTIQISNNGTSAISNGVAVFSLSTSEMITGRMINGGATDASMVTGTGGSDLAFMPGYGTNPWCTWVNSVGGSSSIYEYLYSLNATGGKIAYFSGPTGLTVYDATTPEISNNFSISFTGYIDTTKVGEIVWEKPEAITTFVSGTGNITSYIYTTNTTILYPNAAGDLTQLTPSAAPNWDCVNDLLGSSDNATTRVYTQNATETIDFYNLTDPGYLIPISVKVYFAGMSNYGSGKARPYLKLGSANTTGTQISLSTDPTWTTYSEVLARPGGGRWLPADLYNLQVGISIQDDGSHSSQVTLECVEITYCPVQVTASGLSSGEKTITVAADGTYLTMDINGVNVTTSTGTEILRPNAVGDETSITSQWPNSTYHWDKVCEAVADGSTYVFTDSSTYLRDLYNLPAHSVGSGTINSITIYFRCYTAFIGNAKPSQKSGATITDGTEVTASSSFVTYSQIYTTNPATGLVYTWDDIDGLQIGVSIKGSSGISDVVCTQVYVVENLSAISSVPDNSNNWTFGSENATPYFTAASISVGGVSKGSWAWEYGATFTDLSGNGNTATPSFRTTSSSINMTGIVLSQKSTYQGTVPSSNVSGGWTMITTVPVAPVGLLTEGGYGFPGGSLIKAAAEAAGQDPETWLFLFAFGLAIAAAIFVFATTHNSSMGKQGSMLLSAVAAEAVLIYFYSTHTIPGLALVPLGIITLFLLVWRKTPNPID